VVVRDFLAVAERRSFPNYFVGYRLSRHSCRRFLPKVVTNIMNTDRTRLPTRIRARTFELACGLIIRSEESSMKAHAESIAVLRVDKL